jgi:peptidoglycan/xylan/chitin deacetylase (PgdA/CDA1 family)
MRIWNKWQCARRWEVIIFSLVGGWLLLQSSCTTPDAALKKIKSAFKNEASVKRIKPATTKKPIKSEEVAEKKSLKKGHDASKKTSSKKRETPVQPVVLRQNEYVVHVLREGETPVALAKEFLGNPTKSWVIEDANEGIRFKEGQTIVIPLKEENKGGLTKNGYQVVPILVYHHFAKKCQSLLCMPSRIFDKQMKYLKNNGYRVISLGELLGFLRYRHAIPKKSVVITIDDGYGSAYQIAYPTLKKYGFTATLFVYTDFIGNSSSAITYDQLREMKADGFEVGSHTLSHADLTKRRKGESEKAYWARIRKELVTSRKIINRKLGQKTRYLSLPYGNYNDKVLRLCEQVGYKMALSVQRGGNPFFADPLFLRRDQVLERDMKNFISRLKTFRKLSLK